MEILKAYGATAMVLLFVGWFTVKHAWPYFVRRGDEARADRKAEMGTLITAVQDLQTTNRSQAQAMREQAETSRQNASSAREIHELLKDMRRENRQNGGGHGR